MISPRFRRTRNIHFIGIGGSGMCGIAEILYRMEFHITGSDQQESANTRNLSKMGIQVTLYHHPDNLKDADVVVVSSAIDDSNTEVQQAKKLHLPLVPRAVMLGELMRYRYGIAIAGTHGKTSTTSMLATIFARAGHDPTYVIGGKLRSIGSNAYLGKGHHLITEADESDASFTHLQPQVSIVTNIELDHMEHYGNNPESLYAVFLQFLHNLPFYGLAVLCIDDANIRRILPAVGRPVITYGLSAQADYAISNFTQQGVKSTFEVTDPHRNKLTVKLSIPGVHNALNATACIALARDMQLPDSTILAALEEFAGVARRFEILGNFAPPSAPKSNKSITLVDDYGHHPTELTCTIEAARKAWPTRRLVMVFQPHRYSRTRDLFDEFIDSLLEPDLLILLETYPAGEKPIPGFDSKSLANGIRQRGEESVFVARDMAKLEMLLESQLIAGDLLITQGAGNVGVVASNLAGSELRSVRQQQQ